MMSHILVSDKYFKVCKMLLQQSLNLIFNYLSSFKIQQMVCRNWSTSNKYSLIRSPFSKCIQKKKIPTLPAEPSKALRAARTATAFFTFSSFWYKGDAKSKARSSASFSGAAWTKLEGILPSSFPESVWKTSSDLEAGMSAPPKDAPTSSW